MSAADAEYPNDRVTPADLLPLIPTYVGHWVAEKTRSIAEIELSGDCRATVRYKRGSEAYKFWRLVKPGIVGIYRDNEIEYEILDPDRLHNGNMNVTLVRSPT